MTHTPQRLTDHSAQPVQISPGRQCHFTQPLAVKLRALHGNLAVIAVIFYTNRQTLSQLARVVDNIHTGYTIGMAVIRMVCIMLSLRNAPWSHGACVGSIAVATSGGSSPPSARVEISRSAPTTLKHLVCCWLAPCVHIGVRQHSHRTYICDGKYASKINDTAARSCGAPQCGPDRFRSRRRAARRRGRRTAW
jgi:hypothetical protein